VERSLWRIGVELLGFLARVEIKFLNPDYS
jgi:hypothetical protein